MTQGLIVGALYRNRLNHDILRVLSVTGPNYSHEEPRIEVVKSDKVSIGTVGQTSGYNLELLPQGAQDLDLPTLVHDMLELDHRGDRGHKWKVSAEFENFVAEIFT